MFEVKVKGLEQLNARVKELTTEMQTSIAKGAASSAASLLKGKVREGIKTAGIKEDTGTLDRAVYMAFAKDASSAYDKHYVVGVRQGKKYRKAEKDAYYWWWLEFGTSKMRPRPFVVPAFEQNREAMLERMVKYLQRRLKKYGV